MQRWQELVKTALIGTEHGLPEWSSGSEELDALLSEVGSSGHEHRLLCAAGMLSLYRRAGKQCERAEEHLPIPESATVEKPETSDEKKPVGLISTGHLIEMLHGPYRSLLDEWLLLVVRSGRRIPEEFLPDLLYLARDQSLRPFVQPLLSERGQWLIRQNPEWQYALQTSDESLWETGTRNERIGLLQTLREQNPTRALELMQSTWAQETAEDRAVFTTILKTGLSMADEPFLESLLNDKRREVRLMAAYLLSCMPESQLVRRMVERLKPLVQFKKTLMREQLEIELPAACDDSMMRDGIRQKPPSWIGQRAWWLLQIISCVPPQYWCEQFHHTPEQWLYAIHKHEHEEAVLEGWIIAAGRFRDTAWSVTLLERKVLATMETHFSTEVSWEAAIPPDELDALLTRVLSNEIKTFRSGRPVFRLLCRHHNPWSMELSRLFMQAMCRLVENPRMNSSYDWAIAQQMREFARFVPPELVEEFSEGWRSEHANWRHWQKPVDEFLAMLRFRREMRKALMD